jgi:hypothetical protein
VWLCVVWRRGQFVRLQTSMEAECISTGHWLNDNWLGKTEFLGGRPVLMPLRVPHILRRFIWDCTRVSAVRDRPLTSSLVFQEVEMVFDCAIKAVPSVTHVTVDLDRQWSVQSPVERVRKKNCPPQKYSLRHFSAALRKATISFIMSARLSVRMEQLSSHWTNLRVIWYLIIFRKSVWKLKFHSDKNYGYFT